MFAALPKFASLWSREAPRLPIPEDLALDEAIIKLETLRGDLYWLLLSILEDILEEKNSSITPLVWEFLSAPDLDKELSLATFI